MRRDLNAPSLFQDPYAAEEDADPRVGLVNLADVMLVFACGLMVAIVAHWNVNLSEVETMDDTRLEETADVQELISDMRSGGGYVERGQVYQDPETGQMYLLEEEPQG